MLITGRGIRLNVRDAMDMPQTDKMALPTLHNRDVLLDRVAHASREIIFFFGSALSVPEADGMPGVPNVAGILSLVEAQLKTFSGILVSAAEPQDAGKAYRAAFEKLLAHRGQDAANEVIRHAVIRARKPDIDKTRIGGNEPLDLNDLEVCRKLDEDNAGWHLRASLVALGKLLSNRPGRIGSTVLTTNFDPLIQVAVRMAKGWCYRTVLHSDGSLGQSESPDAQQIVYLHGYWYGKDTLHLPIQINSSRPKLKRSLEQLLQNRTLVIMGCGGWDDIFMSCLSDLVNDTELNPDVIWAFYDSDEQKIFRDYRHIFEKLSPGVERGRVHFYSGVDIHTFLPELQGRLESGNNTDEQRQINEILEQVGALAPELRQKISQQIDPSLLENIEKIRADRSHLEQELVEARNMSQKRINDLKSEAAHLALKLAQAESALTSSKLALTSAAMKDLSWLTMIRTQMMPKQPGRVPFHNSQEVALRGYHAAAGAQRAVPLLQEVTWSRVPYIENGLHRGYKAAIILKGSNFIPGGVITSRRRGEGFPAGNNDYFWRLPNIYFGDYLEISSSDIEPESTLSYRDYEFQVKNPEGRVSEWVAFTYPFDDILLEKIRTESYSLGISLLEQGRATEAVEPLRKAWVFTDRIFGAKAQETLDKMALWNRALDESLLSKLRFRVGDHLKVVSGDYVGVSGTVEKLLLRHLHAYLIKPLDGGELFQASDGQVESDPFST